MTWVWVTVAVLLGAIFLLLVLAVALGFMVAAVKEIVEHYFIKQREHIQSLMEIDDDNEDDAFGGRQFQSPARVV